MLIDGFDVATSCGWASIQRPGDMKATKCGVYISKGENSEEKAGELGLFLMNKYRNPENRPDFVAIEMPQRNVQTFTRQGRPDLAGTKDEMTINPNALQLSGMLGAVVTILNCYNIPWGLIAPATWRKAYYGAGYNPPKAVVKSKNKRTGEIKETYKDDWKQAAINTAQLHKISLPATKAEQKDAAEAIGIAVAWEKCTFIPKRHEKAFMALRMGQPVRSAA